MPEPNNIAALLMPELESELAITRHALDSIPDSDFHSYRPHQKSTSFDTLVGHVAEMPMYAAACLSSPPIDLKTAGMKTEKYTSKAQILDRFDGFARQLVSQLKDTANETFAEPWKLSVGDYLVFEGTRYNAYRSIGINHMVHHRAQLGLYLRLNHLPVPKTYGPSGDES